MSLLNLDNPKENRNKFPFLINNKHKTNKNKEQDSAREALPHFFLYKLNENYIGLEKECSFTVNTPLRVMFLN